MGKCPICNSELTESYKIVEDYGISESLYECKNCNKYSEQFAYGNYEIGVGGVVFHPYYNMPEEENKTFNDVIKILAEYYKRT